MNDIKIYFQLIIYNFKSILSRKLSFFTQTLFMAANNIIYFLIWWIYFKKFPVVNGWTLNDMIGMYAIVQIAFGLHCILGGGSRDLARIIQNGELDTHLTTPQSPYLQVMGSKSYAMGIGDILSGVLFCFFLEEISFFKLALITGFSVTGAMIFTFVTLISQSISFWVSNFEALGRQIVEFLIMFSSYPPTIYGGVVKIILFTIIPAAFVGFLPATVLSEFSLLTLSQIIGATVLIFLLSFLFFNRGLKTYSSGSQFSFRQS